MNLVSANASTCQWFALIWKMKFVAVVLCVYACSGEVVTRWYKMRLCQLARIQGTYSLSSDLFSLITLMTGDWHWPPVRRQTMRSNATMACLLYSSVECDCCKRFWSLLLLSLLLLSTFEGVNDSCACECLLTWVTTEASFVVGCLVSDSWFSD